MGRLAENIDAAVALVATTYNVPAYTDFDNSQAAPALPKEDY